MIPLANVYNLVHKPLTNTVNTCHLPAAEVDTVPGDMLLVFRFKTPVEHRLKQPAENMTS